MNFPETIDNEALLEEILSAPGTGLIEMMKRLDGDIMILGIGGKMGLTMGRQAVNAIRAAGVSKKVIGVSRFSDAAGKKKLEQWGLETISCDLLDQNAVKALPEVKNVIFMAGRKFGTEGSEELTWVSPPAAFTRWSAPETAAAPNRFPLPRSANIPSPALDGNAFSATAPKLTEQKRCCCA